MISGEEQDKPLFSYDHLSGEYVTWNFVWSVNLTALGLDNLVLIVDNYGTVYCRDIPNAFGGASIDYLGAITNHGLDSPLAFWIQSPFSIDKKFVVFEDIGVGTQIGVMRYGVNIWERNIALDDPNILSMDDITMSPNGKFIAVSCFDAVTADDDLVVLYEGA